VKPVVIRRGAPNSRTDLSHWWAEAPYCGDIWRTYCCLISFFPIVDICLSCEDMARQSCAMVPRWQFLATLLRPVFSASHLQHVSDLHLKFAIRPHHVWKYGSHIPSGDNKNLKPALVVLYDVQPENGSGLFLQPEDLYGSVTVREFTLLPYLPTRKHR